MVAHADPPVWLFELRNFGTPLLIIGSAVTYSFIYREKSLIKKKSFFKKRFKRLIIPAWIFLTFFFLSFYTASIFLEKEFPFSREAVINSYNFYNGIGFVWILKVYMLLALLTPLGLRLSKAKSIKNHRYFIAILSLFIAYEILLHLFFERIPMEYRVVISNTVLLIIPYTALYLYGMRLHLLKERTLQIIILVSLVVYGYLAVTKYLDTGTYVSTQDYKYPPRLYYISYAFFFINLIYYLISKYLAIKNERLINGIVWLSSNSLWIYLWHIMAFYLWITFINRLDFSTPPFLRFLIQASFLFLFGIAATYLQVKLVNTQIAKEKPRFKKVLLLLK